MNSTVKSGNGAGNLETLQGALKLALSYLSHETSLMQEEAEELFDTDFAEYMSTLSNLNRYIGKADMIYETMQLIGGGNSAFWRSVQNYASASGLNQ